MIPLSDIKKKYKSVTYFKPAASRKESSEIYIVAKNFLN